MADGVVLVGDRVELRRWRAEDAPAVHRICQDPEIQRWTAIPVRRTSRRTPTSSSARCRSGSGRPRRARCSPWSTAAPQTWPAASGCSGFHKGTAAVGYWTAPQMRSAGRTAEALRLLTGWCFAERGCARVEVTTDRGNLASRGVAWSAGSVEAGVLRGRMLHRGRRIDEVICSRLPTDPD